MTILTNEVEVLSQPERRRRWSLEEKLRAVAEMMEPGASASRVARRRGISTGLLYTWRRQARSGALSVAPAGKPAFVPVRLTTVGEQLGRVKPVAGAGDARDGAMVIELPGDRRIHVDRHVDIEALRRVLSALVVR